MTTMENLVSLCKRRGFIFRSSEIYGGIKGFYDFGPLGVELKNSLKQAWWRSMIYERDDIEGLDAATIGHQKLFKYSGHVDTFNDPLVDCKDCQHRMRADHMADTAVCENCKSTNVTEPRAFNMMFKMNIGPVESEESKGFLRPETAQHIFANFKNVTDAMSPKIPFGIAQIGKAYRNEIVARNFVFRLREFEQMELEYFCKPEEEERYHNYWLEQRIDWWVKQGISRSNLRVNNVPKEELAHYSQRTFDLEYRYPHGFDELEGIASRSDYDLGNHTKGQGELKIHAAVHENRDSTMKLAVRDEETNEWYLPFVIEPSAGVERGFLAILNEAYHVEQTETGKDRIVLKLPRHLSPIKVAIVPLKRNNAEIVGLCHQIKDSLMPLGLGRVHYENTGNIGKAYRRHDEVGTPICVTVDFDSIDEQKQLLTVRNRDTMKQEKVSVDKIKEYVRDFYQS